MEIMNTGEWAEHTLGIFLVPAMKDLPKSTLISVYGHARVTRATIHVILNNFSVILPIEVRVVSVYPHGSSSDF
jgi:hypothetical protein